MSKMSQLHAELSEQATDLGYETLEQALNDGWCVDYDEGRLYKRIDVQEEAHAEWLKEKQQVLNELVDAIHDDSLDWTAIVRRVEHAIEFIEKGEV